MVERFIDKYGRKVTRVIIPSDMSKSKADAYFLKMSGVRYDVGQDMTYCCGGRVSVNMIDNSFNR